MLTVALTFVIALVGIATGIGAIWTARVTERSFRQQNERVRSASRWTCLSGWRTASAPSVRRHREPEGLVVADGPVEVANQYHQMIQNGSTPRAPNRCPRVRLIEVTSVLSPVASTPSVR